MAIALRYAARSDVGLVRSNNQDSGFAGPSLLIIADGMGGHAGGDIASSMAIGEMAPLNDMEHGFDAALDELQESLRHVQRELEHRVVEEPALSGMGTTVTALLMVGDGRLAMAHIGDSRAYCLHNGRLDQITRDHTFVQRLVDDGRITLAEAEQHPQRSVLMRVLSDVMDDVDPDLAMIDRRSATGTCCARTASPEWSASRRWRRPWRSARTRPAPATSWSNWPCAAVPRTTSPASWPTWWIPSARP